MTKVGMNASEVIANLDVAIENGHWVSIREECDKFSIFDWWKESLSVSDMKKMRNFLRLAEKYGFGGYCCFKVGVSGCANGMWAHKKESEDGYSPDGDYMFRSFTPDYVDWNANIDGEWILEGYDNSKSSFKAAMAKVCKTC
ncbi:MAG: hypothetical protein IJJ44_12625 [Solobacterium sp.]|nr:hypothetical protein [Solobacterium sp.]